MMQRTLVLALLSCGAGAAQPSAGSTGELGARLTEVCAGGGAECPLGREQDQNALSLLQGRAADILASGRRSGQAAAEAVQAEVMNKSLSAGNSTDASPPSAAPTAVVICAWVAASTSLLAFALFTALQRKPEEKGTPAIVAEFIGTFMLVFSVGCNVLVGDSTWGVVSIACTLMVSIYALGGVSGGHFNPAVSAACLLTGKMTLSEAVMYASTQMAAGILAGLSYSSMLGDAFSLGPSEGFDWWQAGLAELIYTFMLCFVVLNVAASKKHAGKEQFYGLAIGFVIVAGGYGAGSISGGCFNPAVAFGIDVSSSALGFGWCFAYLGFELLGSVLAAVLFYACRPDDFGSEGPYSLGVRTLSEFLGTFMLVLTVGLNVIANSKAIVFSIAASLMCMIFALGSCSGAHFNPAVTTAVLCRGKIGLGEAITYIIAQLTAGVAAAFTYSAMENGKTVYLGPSGSSGEALLGELIFTFLLAFVVLCVATVESPLSEYFGLAIGSCVTAGGLAIGALSGGSLNPAVSAGLSISDLSNGGSVVHLPSYAAAELLGGVLAAGVFRATHGAGKA